jgi:prepilin-type N-terminal cleavage/methylation domain-containing protein
MIHFLPIPKTHLFKKGLFSKVSSGFTLIELIFVIATLSLIFGLGYSNYRDFQRRQYLDSAVQMVAADLRLAKEKAISGVKPATAPCDSKPLEGYTFRRYGTGGYRIYADCSGWYDVEVKRQNLPTGVTMSSFGGSNFFVFKSLAKGLDPASDINITLNYPGSSVSSQTIVVTSTGEIRVP